jgi:hypothetical protein
MAVAAADPGRAERLAGEAMTAVKTLPSGLDKQEAFDAAIDALARFDPAQAERRARQIRKRTERARALAIVAAALVRHNRPRARALAEEAVELTKQAVRSGKTVGYLGHRESISPWELSRLVPTIATVDPDLAEKTALSLPDEERASALSILADVLPDTQRDRAFRLLEDVLRIRSTAENAGPWVNPIFKVLEVLAAHEPEIAEQTAAELPAGWPRDRGLMALALGLAQADAERAEKVAATIPDPLLRRMALTGVAKAVAHTNVDDAVKIAARIRNRRQRNDALISLAEMIAQVDPSRTEAIARSIKNPDDRKRALQTVAEAMAKQDPTRAEHIAEELESVYVTDSIFAAVGRAYAATDRARAKRFAAKLLKAAKDAPAWEAARLRSAAAITWARIDLAQAEDIIADLKDPDLPNALAAMAAAAAAFNPDGAERIAQQLDAGFYYGRRSAVLATVAKTVATYDIDRALRIAKAAQLTGWEVHPLSQVLAGIAAGDPAQAHTLARDIEDPSLRAEAVAEVAAAAAAAGALPQLAVPADTMQLLGGAEKPEPLLKGVVALARSAVHGSNRQLTVDLLTVLIEMATRW